VRILCIFPNDQGNLTRRAVRARLRPPPPSLYLRAFAAGFVLNPRQPRQFPYLAAPEKAEFEPHPGNFGLLSLWRILLGPRENQAITSDWKAGRLADKNEWLVVVLRLQAAVGRLNRSREPRTVWPIRVVSRCPGSVPLWSDLPGGGLPRLTEQSSAKETRGE
jgi:hypothetical protein